LLRVAKQKRSNGDHLKLLVKNVFITRVFLVVFAPVAFVSFLYSELCSAAEVDSYVRYLPSRSVDAMPGEVGVVESEAECSQEYKIFSGLPVKLSLNTQYIGIENTTPVELPAHLFGLAWDAEATFPFWDFKKTYLRLGVSPSFYADDWNFPASAFRIPVRSLLIYLPNARWTFLAGLAVYPDFENRVLPILGFIYKPNEKLIFNITPRRPNISYILDRQVTLFAEGGSSLSEFEVSKDNTENVVLSYKETRLGGGIEFTPRSSVKTSLSAGGVFNRSLKYRDSLGKVGVRGGFYTELRLEWKL
jgi:hypothetical protein